MNLYIKDGVIESISQLLTRWSSITRDFNRGSLDSGFVLSPVRYFNLFRAPIRVSMSYDHNPEFVSFRIMFDVKAELSGGTTICGEKVEVNGFVGLISISLWFGFYEIYGFGFYGKKIWCFWVGLNVWVMCILSDCGICGLCMIEMCFVFGLTNLQYYGLCV